MNQCTTNQPIGSTTSNVPIDMNQVNYVGAHFCKNCGSAYHNYEQGWYDEYTGKKMFKWGCSKYGCPEHCFIMGGCIYTQKHFWSPLICERCGHIWGEYN